MKESLDVLGSMFGRKLTLRRSILLLVSGLAVLHSVEFLPQSLLHSQNFSHGLFEKSIEL